MASNQQTEENSAEPQPDPNTAGAARKVRIFVDAHALLIDSLIADGRYLKKSDRQRLSAAWGDAQTTLDAIHREVTEQPTKLINVGLAGAELDAKLGLWRRSILPFGRRLKRGMARRALEAGSVVMGSLASEFKVAERLLEIGQTVSMLIDPDQ